jgi:hypothetical protein
MYVVPLAMTGRPDRLRAMWPMIALFTVLLFGTFQIKKTLDPIGAMNSYVHFRLMNRVLVAVMLATVGGLMRMWARGKADADDPELPETFRHQDREISETLAVICCAPLTLMLGVIDLLMPANYNLAILYVVPLFICVWTTNRKFLWSMFAVLATLAVAAPFLGPDSTDPDTLGAVVRNRGLALIAMFLVTLDLHRQLGRRPHAVDGQSDAEN